MVSAAARAQFTFTTNDEAITITGYTGTGGAVVIPGSTNGYPVTAIGDDAFIFNTKLTGITFPDSLISIGDYAFYGCQGLTNVTIPDNVNRVGMASFEFCPNLAAIFIGGGVTNIGADPFVYCSSLTNIMVADGNPCYRSVAGVLFDRDLAVLIQYPPGLAGDYLIPASVTRIVDGAFDASLLKSITIPGTVTNVGSWAFAECASLTNVVLGDGVISLGAEAFYEAPLAEITLPGSLVEVGASTFAECRSLTAIHVNTNNLVYHSENGVLFDRAQTTLVQYPAAAASVYVIPASVTRIGDLAFFYSGLTTITIPGTVHSIGFNAFAYSLSLTNVTLGSGVTDIGLVAFYECRQLAAVTIPSSVTNIGAEAFYECDRLMNISIPGSVTRIGANAFNMCANLTNVVLADGIQSIGSQAFADCYRLSSIIIPKSATLIGTGAFSYSPSMAAIYFKGNPPDTGDVPWLGDDVTTAYYLPGTTNWDNFAVNAGIPVAPWMPQWQPDTTPAIPGQPFRFTINWASGQTVVVNACSNLTNPAWHPIQTIVLTNDTVRFSDPEWSKYPARFYVLGWP